MDKILKGQSGLQTPHYFKTYGIDPNKFTSMFTSLKNKGISNQVAFETAWQSIKENPKGFYSFGRKAANLDDWSNKANSSLTTGIYKAARDSTSFEDWRKKTFKYNRKPTYTNWLRTGRNEAKDYINTYINQNNLGEPIALLDETDGVVLAKKGNKLTELRNKANKFYKEMAASPWGTVYDAANVALMAIPQTRPLAAAMSLAQGAAAINNASLDGFNTNNVLDMLGAATAGYGRFVSKPIMRLVGRTDKYVRKAPYYKPINETHLVTTRGGLTFDLGKHRSPLWQMALDNKAYLPYAAYIYGQQGINTGQVINDLYDNYQSYIDQYLDLLPSAQEAVDENNEKGRSSLRAENRKEKDEETNS